MQTLSKKQVKKAGELLTIDPKNSEAMDILSQWRSLHAYPLNMIYITVKRKAEKLKLKNTIVAQRLKRTPSIVRKLQRNPSMSLARMQDIGGIRVIVPKIDDVYLFHKSLVSSKHQHEPILPPKDYIKEPKPDGYRSLHQVFKYNSNTYSDLKGLQIESAN